MHDIDLILTLTGGLAAALAFGYLTHRLGLSPIVGYLLAGSPSAHTRRASTRPWGPEFGRHRVVRAPPPRLAVRVS